MIVSAVLLAGSGTTRRRRGPGTLLVRFALLALALATVCGVSAQTPSVDAFVRISPRDPQYFELSDGTAFIPNGLNLVFPNSDRDQTDEARTARMESWMESLAAHRGNLIRLWLGHEFWDVEPERLGHYDEAQAARIHHVLERARELGLRVKMCMEQFRRINTTTAAGLNPIFNQTLYHPDEGGHWEDVTDWLRSPDARDQFRDKMAWYHEQFGDDPTIFAWELWNEMDAVATSGEGWKDWTAEMILSLGNRFPRNLVTQSWGSFDKAWKDERYIWLAGLPGNDIAQVHRYLDLGAEIEICKGPMDELAADAVTRMRAWAGERPVLLAETGGVQPRHAGPFELYSEDRDGILLHDVLFAPFFAGAAGTGQIWHWVDDYVDANGLWYHFARFDAAIAGVDPAEERFEPRRVSHHLLRNYALVGRNTILVWCRDAENTWISELQNGIAPAERTDLSLPASSLVRNPPDWRVSYYDPWKDTWQEPTVAEESLRLPPFRRSIVVRLERIMALGG